MPLSEASPLEAFALLASGYVYVDVRSEPEFDEGRPRGAVNVPWRKFGVRGLEPNAAFVEDVRARFERDARIVVGCKFGDRARRAAAVLAEPLPVDVQYTIVPGASTGAIEIVPVDPLLT